jgi:transposase
VNGTPPQHIRTCSGEHSAARSQGGGTAPVNDRAVFTGIVCVLTSGCAWRDLPPSLGVTVPTAHSCPTVPVSHWR